jgi:hypothetical protein
VSVNEGLVPEGFSHPTIDDKIQGVGRLTPLPDLAPLESRIEELENA